MERLQPVRGTHDLLPDEQRRHRRVIDTARRWAERYGFAEVAVPVFEFTDVFARTLGESSDVVTKEMYTFADRSGESLTLRPEFTAGIVRALISNGLANRLPLRWFSSGPVFRHERPQKGRLRQFHQINVETLGIAGPEADIEAIALAADVLAALGVAASTNLELNTLGDADSRRAYRERLVTYFSGHVDALSEDSRVRLERNPLRILDSKDEGDRKVIAGAPSMTDSLNEASREFFARVRAGLDRIGVSYEINPRLVRGLYYYTHTAFEFTTADLGAQGAVIAGGRYDGLAEAMGGPPTPGIGWAGGIERLAMLTGAAPPAPRPVALVPLGAAGADRATLLAHELRRRGYIVDLGDGGSLSKGLKRANKAGACAAVLLGDDELAKGVAVIRDLDTGDQREADLAGLADALGPYRGPVDE